MLYTFPVPDFVNRIKEWLADRIAWMQYPIYYPQPRLPRMTRRQRVVAIAAFVVFIFLPLLAGMLAGLITRLLR